MAGLIGGVLHKWRTVLWALVLLALFDRKPWKERRLIVFIVGTTIGVIGSFAAAGGSITFGLRPEEMLSNSSTKSMALAVSALIYLLMWLEKKGNGRHQCVRVMLGGLYTANNIGKTC